MKLLTVQVNRARRWYRPGLLCIGDTAPINPPLALRLLSRFPVFQHLPAPA